MIDQGAKQQSSDQALRHTVARGVRRARKERGLSQEGLARAAECSYGLVRRVESAVGDTSLTMIDRLARALGTSGADVISLGAREAAEGLAAPLDSPRSRC